MWVGGRIEWWGEGEGWGQGVKSREPRTSLLTLEQRRGGESWVEEWNY